MKTPIKTQLVNAITKQDPSFFNYASRFDAYEEDYTIFVIFDRSRMSFFSGCSLSDIAAQIIQNKKTGMKDTHYEIR